MEKFYFDINKHFSNSEMHYDVVNIDSFANYYNNDLKSRVKAIRKETENTKYKEPILVNNLKIISQQIINKLNVKVSVVKQVDGEEYTGGNGVRNIKILTFPYCKLIDVNVLVGKQAEVIESEEEFDVYAKLAEEMIKENDNVVPNSLASTIRKNIIKAFEDNLEFRNIQWSCRVTQEEFMNFKKFYHGGICMTNKEFEGETLFNVYHADMTSAYITQMVYNIFPTSKPIALDITKLTQDEVRHIFQNKFYLAEIKLVGAKLKNPNINPLNIDEGDSVIYITNLDYQILKDTITINHFLIGQLYVFPKLDKLPKVIRDIMYGLFSSKQEIKAVKGTEDFNPIKYEVAKTKVNCSYGVFGSGIDVKYCNIFWAIYTTAWQRFTLWNEIKLNGLNNFVCCDTDSIFSIDVLRVQEGNELGKWDCDKFSRMVVRGCKGYITEDYDTKEINIIMAGATKSGIMNYIRSNNISNDTLFSKNYFVKMTIPAEYEVCYRYVANDKEVYKKCYEIGEKRSDTILNILLDKYNIKGVV